MPCAYLFRVYPPPETWESAAIAMLSAAAGLALLLVPAHALLPAHALRCDHAARVQRPSACVRRALRASPLRLSAAGGDSGSGDSVGDELEAALRKALSEMPAQEMIDSDRRLLDGLVDEAQANDLSASMSALDRELASVQEAMDSKIDSKLRDLEGETMRKIDAAVEELRKGRTKLDPKEGSWEAADAAAVPLPLALPLALLLALPRARALPLPLRCARWRRRTCSCRAWRRRRAPWP